MSAIANYESRHNLPHNYINTAIHLSGQPGAWARLERGEIPLDAAFFSAFTKDICSPAAWAKFRCPGAPPHIDGEQLFWAMMAAARAPDPYVYPALQALRAHADATRDFIVAACSNTVHFPEGHAYTDPTTAEGRVQAELRANFDIFVSSAHVGVRKPERKMYEMTLRECERVAREKGGLGREERLDPGDVVFLDDIGSNLRGAREAGITRGIKVVIGETENAVKELEKVTGLQLRGKAKL